MQFKIAWRSTSGVPCSTCASKIIENFIGRSSRNLAGNLPRGVTIGKGSEVDTPVPGGIANVDQADAWNGPEGVAWAAQYDRYDTAMHGYHTRLLDAAGIGPTEHVLDVGCGCGETTRDAARAAASGHALGVDISALMLDRARAIASVEGLTNVVFEQGDAQVYPFESEAFDIVISRFGAM